MPDLQLLIEGVDKTDRVLWEECSFEEAADEGTIGNATIIIRDTGADQNPTFGKDIQLLDHGQLAWRGIVSPRERGREDDTDHYSVRRMYRVTGIDRNHLLDFVRVEGYVRSSETDYTRVRAAFGTYRPTVDVTTFVPNSGNVTMDAQTYRDGMLRDLVSDCAEEAGKDYWIDRFSRLHYAVPGSLSSNHAPFTLSDTVASYAGNILVDPTPTIFNIGYIVRRDDPNSIPLQNDVILKYGTSDPASSVQVEDATSIATYGRIQGPPLYDTRARSSASATNRANAYLSRSKDPEISYETTIALPRLDIIQAGQWVDLYSGHQQLTGQRAQIVRWTARRKGNAYGGYWEVDLELAARRRRRGAGFRGPSEPAQPEPAPPEEVDDGGTTEVNGSLNGHIHLIKPGVYWNAIALTAGGFDTNEANNPAGYGYSAVIVSAPGFACPAGLEYYSPGRNHCVMRFNTSAWTRIDFAFVRLTISTTNPEAFGGPFDIYADAFYTTSSSQLTAERFYQGTRAGSSPMDKSTNVIDLPAWVVNVGGNTDLSLRPFWPSSVIAVVCAPTADPDVPPFYSRSEHADWIDAYDSGGTGQLGHMVNTPNHWRMPGDARRVWVDSATLTPMTIGAGFTGWMDAIVATTSDDSDVPAGNDDNEGTALWWKVPARTYTQGKLEVNVGGRILVRDVEWFQDDGGLVFELAKAATTLPPRVRYVAE